MAKRFVPVIPISSALLISLATIWGCADKNTGGGNAGAAGDGKIIAASFYPMYIAALNIASGASGARIVNMAPTAAGCLHDYQMTTADAMLIEKAAALIINGGGMDTFLDKAASANTGLTVVNAGEGIAFMPNCTRTGSYHSHDHHHNHHIENNGGVNAHAWMSIENHIAQIKNIAAGLSAADAANADIYAGNAQRYVNQLTALMESAQGDFSSVNNKKIAVTHNGFEYLARDLGLTVTVTVEQEPGVEPGAQEIVRTIRLIERERPNAIFAEQGRHSPISKMISGKTGVPMFELDMITSGPDDLDAYTKAMEKNISTIKEALR
ncbi:MAG: metal ABC transporter substrate-binding protein [Chitinispirillia bacterium]|nr:metal ABC transporter substrate-binding protein [Chitinispirillia bacterium]MCL2268922.1 metal ABC transporter substrate-binding protein [Chitinispirillia bacterium]